MCSSWEWDELCGERRTDGGLCGVSRLFDWCLALVAAALGLHWQPPADHTLTLLHQAADALGGEATLRSLKAIEMSGVSVWHQREQSERPEGPWVLTFNDFTDVRNLDADTVRRGSGRR